MNISSPFSRKKPFLGYVSVNRRLTGRTSWKEKETRHFEISIRSDDIQYEVGDAIGVFPTNDPELVRRILMVLRFSGEEAVRTHHEVTVPLRKALLKDYAITEPSKALLAAIDKKASTTFLKTLLDPNNPASSELNQYLFGKDVLDILEEFSSIRFTPGEFIGLLRVLQPRLYSVASSQKAYPDSVHLTVSIVRYRSADRLHGGVCSTFLAERATVVPLFVHTAKHFHMPDDPDTPIIMVGPGTGIAPFRAFLQERRSIGARGKNWLFFGGRRRTCDFLYQHELETYCSEGILHQLDTAFSREQEATIYVQHRMLEKARKIYHWLESGAYLYLCGDATHMARAVDDTLHIIVEKAGNKTNEQAKVYIKALKKERRYRRDVY